MYLLPGVMACPRNQWTVAYCWGGEGDVLGYVKKGFCVNTGLYMKDTRFNYHISPVCPIWIYFPRNFEIYFF